MARSLLDKARRLRQSDATWFAVAWYKATWRKLARYVRSLGYGE